MSYTTSKQNSENPFNLSEDFLNRTRLNLNESLDTKEWLLPEKRRANKDEAALASRQLLSLDLAEKTKLEDKFYELTSNLSNSWFFINYFGYGVKQNVLQDQFVAGWENMNLLECVFGSIELYIRISRDLSDTRKKEKWRASIQILLKEKLIASQRALHNLDRVHDAYHNVRPLLNSTVTPNGRYDMLYLTKELFKETTQINDTFTRVRRHIKTYVNNIDGLLHIYSADYRENETVAKCFSYSNAFLTASLEYVKDLRLYESLVIEDPLKQITKGKKLVLNDRTVYSTTYFSMYTTQETIENIASSMATFYFPIREANRLVGAYLHNLSNTRKTSKLAHAIRMISFAHSWTREADTYIYFAMNFLQEHNIFGEVAKFFFRLQYFTNAFIMNMPLMQAFVAKLFDHYKESNRTDKAAMDKYFHLRMNSSFLAKLIRNDGTFHYNRFINNEISPLLERPFSMDNINWAVTDIKSYTNNLEYLLAMTRLTGTFFR